MITLSKNNSYLWDEVCSQAKELLVESDWTQLSDNRLTEAQRTAWATYREDLRGILDIAGTCSVNDIVWPTKPNQGE